jgi:hypothetical protein
MATATLLPPGEQTFFDSNGVPLAGGSVYFYIPSTTTPKTTWLDSAEVTPNSNPVILDSAGRAIIYGNGVYRQVVYDALGNLIWDQLTSGTNTTITGINGQCKLIYTNSTTLTLVPWNGNGLEIAGATQIVPSGGVTLSNSGLTSALTYVYAFMNGSTMTLTGSTTGYVADSTTGVNVLSGNPACTLVGMCYPDSGILFQYSSAERLVRSWYNEDGISGTNGLNSQSDQITAQRPNYSELTISTVAFKAIFLLWNDERVSAAYNWAAGIGGGATAVNTFIGVNLSGPFTGSGSLPSTGIAYGSVVNSGANGVSTIYFGANGGSLNGGGVISEGYNYITMYGAIDTGILSFAGNRTQTRIGYITTRN